MDGDEGFGEMMSRSSARSRHGPRDKIGVKSFSFKHFDERVKEEFDGADVNGDGKLDEEEIKSLLFRVNADVPDKVFRDMFKAHDADGNGGFVSLIACLLSKRRMLFVLRESGELGTLEYDEFRNFFNDVQSLPNVKDEFETWCLKDKSKKLMTCRELQLFLQRWNVDSGSQESQQYTLAECIDLAIEFERWKRDTNQSDPGPLTNGSDSENMPSTNKIDPDELFLSYAGFQKVLSDGNRNHLLKPERVGKVWQDMQHPLSHYFISASHNTYLSGNQLNSGSSAESVAQALKLGVRVVELDTYDDVATGQPIVTHGGTLCSVVPFETCVEAVAKYGFVASEYPVIITIENHCSPSFQDKQAEILTRVLGDRLFRWNEDRVRQKNVSFYSLSESDEVQAGIHEGLGENDDDNPGTDPKIDPNAAQQNDGKKGEDGKAIEEEGEEKEKEKKQEIEKEDEEDIDWKLGPLAWRSPWDLRGKVLIRDKPKTKNDKKEKKGSNQHHHKHSSDHLKPSSTQSGMKASNIDASKKRKFDTDSTQELDDNTGSDTPPHNVDPSILPIEKKNSSNLTFEPLKLMPQSSSSSSASSYAEGKARSSGVSDSDIEDDEDAANESRTKEKKLRSHLDDISVQLLMIIYIKNVKLRTTLVENRFVEPPYKSSSSITESTMVKLTKPGPSAIALTRYANEHLVRIYPDGTRVDSSNYDPSPATACGCQIIALNYQSFGKYVWVMQGFFRENGGCGYVLKSDTMRQMAESGTWALDSMPPKKKLIITMISGHYLPKPFERSSTSEIIDPFVTLQMFGVPQDCAKFSTKVVNNNGFNPSWNQTFTFMMHYPELATLLLHVKDSNVITPEAFVAQNAIPFECLRVGYRVVPLRHANCAPMEHAYLFVRIEIVPYG